MALRIILIGAIVIIGASSLYFFSPSEDAVSEPMESAIVIVMKDLEYSVTEARIKQGETVEFKNGGSEEYWPASNIHPSHGIYPEFDSQASVKPGESWFFRFDKVGSWRFHDHLHPREIKGVIIVE